jgi:5-oxoprolinase (ATP-hydrolysing) subunit A
MSSIRAIDINADMGEGFGRWTLGDDAALMPHVTSTNIACGYHAGDAHMMRRCVQLARRHGVGIGAHIGFPDLQGFGRRGMNVTAEQLRDYVVYQIGALASFAAAEGATMEHVKPHSALYKACQERLDYAEALAHAIHEVDPKLILLMSGPVPAQAARDANIAFVGEALIDLEYDENGKYVPEWPKKIWDPEDVARRAVDIVHDGTVPLRNGGRMALNASSVCIHGEAHNADVVAMTVRDRLIENGVKVMPLRQILALTS